MAHSITLTSTLNSEISRTLNFGPGRQRTIIIPKLGTYTRDSDQVSGYQPLASISSQRIRKGITWDEFINHPEMQLFIRGEVSGVTASLVWDPALAAPDSLQAAYEDGYIAKEEVFYVTVAADAGNTADDVTLMTAAPFSLIITGVDYLVDATGAGDTLTLRSATGGGGSAWSSALPADNAVKVSSTLNDYPAVAEGASIYGRRTDNTTSGIVAIRYIRTAI